MIANPILRRSVSIAMGVTAILAGSAKPAFATSTTMYNLYAHNGTTPCAPCFPGSTDGWVWGFDTPSPGNASAATPGWVGTAGSTSTPFGYTGDAVLHWAIAMTADSDTAQISNANSLSTYGISANIDTAKGAWLDNNNPGASGWTHDLDLGLFRSDVNSRVTLNVQGVNQTGTDFGFTVFDHMSAAGDGYSHHAGWNTSANGTPVPPGGFTVGDIVATSDASGTTPLNLNQIAFDAQAGHIYTIALGGFRNGGWGSTTDGYVLNVAASPVPVPGAVWLLGSALTGLVTIGRSQRSRQRSRQDNTG